MTFKLPFCSNVLIVVHGFHLSGKYWAAKFSKELGSHCCFNGLYFSSWSSQLHPLTWKDPEMSGKHEGKANDAWHCGLVSIMGFMQKDEDLRKSLRRLILGESVTWMWSQQHEALAWSSQTGDGHINTASLPILQCLLKKALKMSQPPWKNELASFTFAFERCYLMTTRF